MSALTSTERRALRARAHHLQPVVIIGQHGLTPAVQHEIDIALAAHELVKLRVQNESRVERQAMLAAICAALDCAPVQQLGKLLIVWRANPDKVSVKRTAAKKSAPDRARGAKGGKAKGGNAKGLAVGSTAASDRRRRRNAQGGKAGDATLPYFSRRGAGRFVANTPPAPDAGASEPAARKVASRASRGSAAPTSRQPAAPTSRRRKRA